MNFSQTQAIEKVLNAFKLYRVDSKDGNISIYHRKSLDKDPIFSSNNAIQTIDQIRSMLGKNRLVVKEEHNFRVVLVGVSVEDVDQLLMQIELKAKTDNYYNIENIIPVDDRAGRTKQNGYPYALREIANSAWFNELRRLVYQYNISERN